MKQKKPKRKTIVMYLVLPIILGILLPIFEILSIFRYRMPLIHPIIYSTIIITLVAFYFILSPILKKYNLTFKSNKESYALMFVSIILFGSFYAISNYVFIYSSLPSFKECNNVSSVELHSQCYTKKAIELKNENICYNIGYKKYIMPDSFQKELLEYQLEKAKSDCFYDTAKALNDSSICYLAGYRKGDCGNIFN